MDECKKPKRKKRICPKCKGTGTVFNHGEGLLTLGLGYIYQLADDTFKDLCPLCNGKKLLNCNEFNKTK